MATATVTGSIFGTSQIKPFHDALLSIGLVQTADTGQLNLSTASPAYVNTVNYLYGYTIYRWSDPLQATNPIYIRVGWKNGNASTGGLYPFFMLISTGSGTDGAGNLTGKVLGVPTTVTVSNGTLGAGSTFTHYFCYVNGALAIAISPDQNFGDGNTYNYTLDRLHNMDGSSASGTYFRSASGVATMTIAGQVASETRTSIQTFGASGLFTPYPTGWYTEDPTFAIAAGVPFFPEYFLDPSPYTTLCSVWVPFSEVPTGTTFTVPRFGGSRTYRTLYANYRLNTYFMQTMIWE